MRLNEESFLKFLGYFKKYKEFLLLAAIVLSFIYSFSIYKYTYLKETSSATSYAIQLYIVPAEKDLEKIQMASIFSKSVFISIVLLVLLRFSIFSLVFSYILKRMPMEIFFKIYMWLEKYKNIIIVSAFFVTFLAGTFIYKTYYNLTYAQSASYGIGLYAVDVKTPESLKEVILQNFYRDKNVSFIENNESKEFKLNNELIIKAEKKLKNFLLESKINREWEMIYYASFFAKFTLFITVFLLFARRVLTIWYRYLVKTKGKHNIIVGLGKNSRFFIDSLLLQKIENFKHRLMVFEIDKEHAFLEKYKNNRVSIVPEDIDKSLDSLNFEELNNAFISTGNDEKNIYYALKFLDKLKGRDDFGKLMLHVEDRTVRNFYSDTVALNNAKIDLKIFSFYKEAARKVLQEHALDGDGIDLIESDEAFSINIVGDSELSVALVVEAHKLAHYPNGNELHINLIGKNVLALQDIIEYSFPEIDKIENVHIHYITGMNSHRADFYTNDVWYPEEYTLKNVFYCHEEVAENIRIAARVVDVTYLRKNSRDIKFHIATMNQIKISEEIIKLNKDNFYIFASARDVCSYENLLANKIDSIARLINYDYYLESLGGKKSKFKDRNEYWCSNKTSVYAKTSSVAQAIHINTKLKFLGLEVKKYEGKKGLNELIQHNEKIIKNALGVTDNDIKLSHDISLKLKKLSLAEHNRWMASLRMMDFEKGKKDIGQKRHPLLKKYEEFSSEEKDAFAVYDINAVVKIGEYEAKVGNVICIRGTKKKS